MKRSGKAWGRWPLLIAWLALVSSAVTWGQESMEIRLLAGLRERRLYTLAEHYCRKRLADPALAELDRGSLTVELLRVLSEQASQSEPELRAAAWTAVRELVERFRTEQPQHPQLFLVRAQGALAEVLRAELLRMEAEIAPDPPRAIELARVGLRESLRSLEDLDGDLTAAIPQRRKSPGSADDLTAEELTSLQYHLRMQMARVYRNQALCYAEGSPDRVAALTQSLERLDGLRQLVAADEPLAVDLQLERGTCLRLLKDYPTAAAQLQELAARKLADTASWQLRAEQVRLQLATAGAQAALARIKELSPASGTKATADFDFAVLETYVGLWQSAAESENKEQAAQWRDKSIEAVKYVEQVHGPYWGRRADTLLVRVGSERGGGGIEILRRAADELYLKGQLDEAVAAYDQAAANAGQDLKSAFELAYKSALVQQQRQLHDDAARRFRDLALRMQMRPEAANAHLLAIVNEAEACQADPSRLDRYIAWLDEHLSLWPYASSSNRVRVWLGKIREHRREWTAAIAAYQGVLRDSDNFLTALEGAERSWLGRIDELAKKGEPVEVVASQAADTFAQTIPAPNSKLPENWNDASRQAVLAAARLRLLFTGGSRAETEQLLRAAMNGLPPPTPEWTATARTLLVVALAGQANRLDEARQLLGESRNAAPEQLLQMARTLDSLRRSASGNAARDLAQLQLLACESMIAVRQRLSEADQVELSRLQAQSLAGSGQYVEADRVAAELIRQRPRDLELRQEYAELLLASGDPALLKKALDQWRITASLSPARSSAWFQAKAGVIRTLLASGDKAGAGKLIRYLQATENLTAAGWSDRFAELLRQCE